QPRSILGCIALRKCDRLVEDDLDRHLALVELLQCDAQDVALDRTEPIRGPVVGRGRDAGVEVGSVVGHRLAELPRVVVHLTLVERPERAARDVPLEEHEDRGASGLAAADATLRRHRTSSSTVTSTASTSTSHIRASASATRSCTAAETSGSTRP